MRAGASRAVLNAVDELGEKGIGDIRDDEADERGPAALQTARHRVALIAERIDPRKDVDGFHPYNIGCLVLKRPTLRPCTPYGCMTLLKDTGEDLAGKHAVVIGQSNIVGRPMALELLMERCTVTICHSRTRDLPGLLREADIVVAGIGKPRFVQGDWIKDGVIVIDVGINRGADGKLCGDVDFDAAKERAAWITPVPGGVGPMTIATLLANTLRAAELLDAEG